jgi:glycosyltransferase involved in cell wall biosynthesis
VRRKRILLVNESSRLATGYAVYGKQMLERLSATGEYELAELACYGSPNDMIGLSLPWKYYPNMPTDDAGKAAYDADPLSVFGRNKFHEVCLSFQPDVVISINDFWAQEYLVYSPYRNHYSLALMATVDGVPIDEKWLSMLSGVEAVCAYSQWSMSELQKVCGKLNTVGVAPAGVDAEVYKPVKNKSELKKSFGFEPDCKIVGSIMRNSKRKLYPDLVNGFAEFLGKVNEPNKYYLYLHLFHPDRGWNIPELLKDSGIARKVYFTYLCRKCRTFYPNLWQGTRSICRNCNYPELFLVNSQNHSLDDNSLAQVFNLFDLYVGLSAAGAQEIPTIQAGACCVNSMYLDYGGPVDYKGTVEATPINVAAFWKESETGRLMAVTDKNDFAKKLIKFFGLPESVRVAKGSKVRRLVEKNYNWKDTIDVWKEAINKCQFSDNWQSPIRAHRPNLNIPDNLDPENFVKFGLVHIVGRPELVDSHLAMRMVRDLNSGCRNEYFGGLCYTDMSILGTQPRYTHFGRNEAIQEFLKLNEYNNFWEEKRSQVLLQKG